MDNLNQRTCGTKSPVTNAGGCCGGGCNTTPTPQNTTPPVPVNDVVPTEPSTGGCCNASPTYEPDSD